MAPGTPAAPAAAGSHEPGPAPTADRLWLFDFDYTIVDDNSDTYIHRCAPGGQLPPAVRDSYVAPDWIGYMNRVLSHLAGARPAARTDGGTGTPGNGTAGVKGSAGAGADGAAAPARVGDGEAEDAETAAVSPEAIKAELERIPWTPGMRRLLEAIRDSGSSSSSAAATTAGGGGRLAGVNHAAILSDANSLFIPWILDGGGGDQQGANEGAGDASDAIASAEVSAGHALDASAAAGRPGQAKPGQAKPGQAKGRLPPLSPMFVDILTNPAEVEAQHAAAANSRSTSSSSGGGGGQAAGAAAAASDAAGTGASGVIRVYPHHGTARQCAAPPHACRRCHANLCKRQAMRQLLQRRAAAGFTYRQVVYVGDGRNDLCPCLALGQGDVAMPRVGFALQKLLAAAAAATTPSTSATAAANATAGTSAAAPTGAATGPGGGNDDFIYAAEAAAAPAAAAAVPAASPEPEPLLAAIVPWRDAYDILAWVAADDKRMAGAQVAAAAGKPEAEGLADRAARIKL
ncbi:hypothetical protein HYH02_007020 [Chlamydomonas schloesseri]|uniref:Pyridoxal phosphate phosphatase PHOSPHO2 n=1 Tax=Chlamydomonas schloesseri TaxID=2026947 RepID=A0A835WIG6_9CHLO|nr:hypothetical protein HYH02_007020 [Chlamydomonas schloesseri]|eukprot:KAG2447992.1 hypothetical protein HYH02_007020 [Chlamydomonas schloesseri]